jgi:hypothetical protein
MALEELAGDGEADDAGPDDEQVAVGRGARVRGHRAAP